MSFQLQADEDKPPTGPGGREGDWHGISICLKDSREKKKNGTYETLENVKRQAVIFN